MRPEYARMETAFPKAYYLGNLARIQDDLRTKGLAAVAIFDPESIYWLTGYRSIGYFTFQCVLVLRDGGPLMVSRRVNHAIALANENMAGFVGIEDTDDAVEILSRTIRERVTSREPIGLETTAWYLTVQAFKALSRAVPNELADWGGLIERARMIKTREQLDFM